MHLGTLKQLIERGFRLERPTETFGPEVLNDLPDHFRTIQSRHDRAKWSEQGRGCTSVFKL